MLLKICMFRWTLNVELIIQISADNINPICKTLQRLQYIFHILIKPNKHEHNIRWGSSRYSMNFMQIYFQNKVVWSRQTHWHILRLLFIHKYTIRGQSWRFRVTLVLQEKYSMGSNRLEVQVSSKHKQGIWVRLLEEALHEKKEKTELISSWKQNIQYQWSIIDWVYLVGWIELHHMMIPLEIKPWQRWKWWAEWTLGSWLLPFLLW